MHRAPCTCVGRPPPLPKPRHCWEARSKATVMAAVGPGALAGAPRPGKCREKHCASFPRSSAPGSNRARDRVEFTLSPAAARQLLAPPRVRHATNQHPPYPSLRLPTPSLSVTQMAAFLSGWRQNPSLAASLWVQWETGGVSPCPLPGVPCACVDLSVPPSVTTLGHRGQGQVFKQGVEAQS